MQFESPPCNHSRIMAKPTFPPLSRRVLAVRAAWRRQVPIKVRVEAVRQAARQRQGEVPVRHDERPAPVESVNRPSSAGGPPVRRIQFESQVA